MAEGNTRQNALVGAVVTVLTSFTGLAPVVGGAVAGYLNRRDGVKVGAISGAIATIPLLFIFFLVGSFLAFVPVMGGGPRAGFGAGLGIVVLVFVFGLLLVYSVGLGALGGYVGEYLYTEDVL
jgi:hypothetical protein